MKTKLIVLLLIAGFCLVSCDKDEDERQIDINYNPVLKPENFVEAVTNIYFPLVPGTVFTYHSQTEDGLETIVITVLSETKMISGIKSTIVNDVVSIDGEVVEDTHDWYAQDKDGNVWYMGEDAVNYENGEIADREGSFEAGVDGAKAGIIMLADPVLELPYRQEYYFNEAEDWGKVVATGVTVNTTYGTFNNCLKTADWNALEPDEPVEFKYYAPGVGLVKEEVENSDENVDLISIE